MSKREGSHVVVSAQLDVQLVVAVVPEKDALISVCRFAASRLLAC
jgi:hypothetical protein